MFNKNEKLFFIDIIGINKRTNILNWRFYFCKIKECVCKNRKLYFCIKQKIKS